MQGQPLLDDDLSSWMDSLIGGEIFLADENVAPGMPMPDAPETGLGTEPADQPFEMDMSLAIEQEQPRLDDGLGWMDILIRGETELVEEPRAPVKDNVSGI
ncbi:hypothetical protein OIU84_028040 [Salix udensis]|uniref:Uncharacterized protein n=1 Tax=Salix udensis TaxID=889485 RepID=A0AAD6P844_9ROSI|nr:hypothetical protein OIU84_028040 [Salix udensis]